MHIAQHDQFGGRRNQLHKAVDQYVQIGDLGSPRRNVPNPGAIHADGEIGDAELRPTISWPHPCSAGISLAANWLSGSWFAEVPALQNARKSNRRGETPRPIFYRSALSPDDLAKSDRLRSKYQRATLSLVLDHQASTKSALLLPKACRFGVHNANRRPFQR
ncbi:hypothetical protein [Bradyrhizobium tunisiense]|uniref:hypothetical protein n=1 Tax=Bradyrhizobium tunisiense TaxID=3278709 RepID=UPI0035D76FFE